MRLELSTLVPLLACAGTARADFLDGRVVDAQGVGVANVDIDIKNLGSGGDPTITNDGTDANGFFHVGVQNGTYRISFNPPPPPASHGLLTEVEPVTVTGTTNMGTVALLTGVALTGRLVDSGGLGVAGVNIDVIDAGGTNVDLLHDSTDVLGYFALNAPTGSTEIRFDTSGLAGPMLAPLALEIAAASDLDLGTRTLVPGFAVSALVRNSGGIAVANCDVDVYDAGTGAKLYTPGDDSNASGFVDFVVPAGTFRFQFCPPVALRLVSRVLGPQAVAGSTSLGIVTLQGGVLLSGIVRNQLGQPVASADVDVRVTATQADVPLCDDSTNAAGAYTAIVPTGTLDVVFLGPPGAGYGSDTHAGVAILGDTVLDGVLPAAANPFCFGDGSGTACPCGNSAAPGSGTGCLSSLGVGGRIVASGTASVAADTLVLSGSQMPSSSALYFQGTTQQNGGLGATFGDGLRCAGGSVIRLGTKTNAAGASQYPAVGDAPISVRGANSAGASRTYQCWYRNAAAFCTASTFNLTNGLALVWGA